MKKIFKIFISCILVFSMTGTFSLATSNSENHALSDEQYIFIGARLNNGQSF